MRNKQFKGEHVTAYPCLPKHLWKKKILTCMQNYMESWEWQNIPLNLI